MNLGIIAASIATLRPLFVNLEPMARITSDTARGPYTSNRLLVKHPKMSKIGTPLSGVMLSPLGSTKSTDVEALKDYREVSEG